MDEHETTYQMINKCTYNIENKANGTSTLLNIISLVKVAMILYRMVLQRWSYLDNREKSEGAILASR
jgi:hypothetical protein